MIIFVSYLPNPSLALKARPVLHPFHYYKLPELKDIIINAASIISKSTILLTIKFNWLVHVRNKFLKQYIGILENLFHKYKWISQIKQCCEVLILWFSW